jgi:hypothetical protein
VIELVNPAITEASAETKHGAACRRKKFENHLRTKQMTRK